MTAIALAIYSPPTLGGASECAFNLSKSLLDQGHTIVRLFFFNEGVLNCSAGNRQSSLPQQWSDLILRYHLDAIVCVASAQKRGIATEKSDSNLPQPLPGFEIAGLAQLIDSSVQANHLVTFCE